jgi:tripartite-type tricarboxylate transporter receptor subunit TctC
MRTWKTWIWLLALAFAGSALAQSDAETKSNLAKLKPKDFPTDPIEFVVVYPAGGGMDITARHLTRTFEKWTGVKTIVNNRTGGAGMVGHTYLATQAKNDGYTVGVVASLILGDAMLRAQGKWQYTDLDPLAYLNSDALYWSIASDGPFKGKSAKEIIQIAKDKPNTVRAAVVPGSFFEYLVEQTEQATGAKFLKVPFQGGAAGLAALIGGSVDIGSGFYSEMKGFLDAGKMTPIAVSSGERSSYLPNVPTFNEILGAKNVVWLIVRWALVPKGVPAERRAYLAAALTAAALDPELQAEYRKMGAVPDSRYKTPAQVAEEINKLAAMEREFYQKTGRLK